MDGPLAWMNSRQVKENMPTLILNRNDACMGVMSLWSTSYFKQAYAHCAAGKELPIFFSFGIHSSREFSGTPNFRTTTYLVYVFTNTLLLMYVNPLYILAECQNNELYLAREDRIFLKQTQNRKTNHWIHNWVCSAYIHKNKFVDLEQGLISLKLN